MMGIGTAAEKIQKLCLPSNNHFPAELYFRGRGYVNYENSYSLSESSACQKKLMIKKGETIRFDTYFNMFAAFKWFHYTSIQDLSINIALKGNAGITILGISRSELKKGITDNNLGKKLYCTKIEAAEESEYQIYNCDNLSTLPDFIYLSVTALSENVELTDISFSTSTKRNTNLNIACCFCTYKRELDIKQNIKNLLSGIIHNESSNLYDHLHVYVADNGQTLPLNLYEKEPAVHIFHNKNYGGSAGFTRCMIESCFRTTAAPFTHIILMDDDALILPEVVERTGALLGILKEEYSAYMIGGAFLSKELPAIQIENGAFLNISKWKITACGSNLNMCSREKVLKNELSKESEVNYNGWWYTCIPTNVITEENLPLPLFIHCDDMEYGYRNKGKFIRLNGICIWHPNIFGANKQKSYVNYYSLRNSLIVQSSYCPTKSAFEVCSRLLLQGIGRAIVNYRYQDAWYSYAAFYDFFKGIDYFKNIDAENLNSKLIKYRQFEDCKLSQNELKKTEIYGFYKLGESDGYVDKDNKNYLSSPRKQKIKKILNWFIPAYKGRVVYNSSNISFKDVDLFGVRELLVVDPETGRGLCFQKNYKQAFKILWHFFEAIINVCQKHGKLYKEWCNRVLELETYDFWKRYLKI